MSESDIQRSLLTSPGQKVVFRSIDALSALSALWALMTILIQVVWGRSFVAFGLFRGEVGAYVYIVVVGIAIPFFLYLGLRNHWGRLGRFRGVVAGFTVALCANCALVNIPYLGIYPSFFPSACLFELIVPKAFRGNLEFNWLIATNFVLGCALGWLLPWIRGVQKKIVCKLGIPSETVDPPERWTSSISFWIVGVILVVGAVALISVFVPMLPCPWCDGEGIRQKGFIGRSRPCVTCDQTGRIPIRKLWTHRDDWKY